MKQWVNISDAVEITNNRVKPFKGERRYLATGDLIGDAVNESIVSVDYDNKPSRADLLVEEGNIIVARMQATNKVLLIDEATEDLIVSTGFLTLQPKKDFDGSYLAHYFRSDLFQKKKNKYCSGATQKAINNGAFAKLQVPSYSLDEQKRIANILDQADALRQKRKQSLQLLDDFLRATFLDMFGDPVINERNWQKKNLSEITNLVTDGKHGDCQNESNSGYYFISAKDVHDGIIDYSQTRQITKKDFEEVHKRTNLEANDLVMVNTGATIGKVAIVKNDIKTGRTTFQKSVAVIKLKRACLLPIFLKYVFALRLRAFVGVSSGSAQKNLLLSQMRKFRIILPPVELQNKFSSIVNQVEQIRQEMQDSLIETDNQFNALTQRYFG